MAYMTQPVTFLFTDLAPIRDPNSVLANIARTIGLQVTSAAVPVTELLQFCPQLKMLTTSRDALRVRGEHQYPVPHHKPLAKFHNFNLGYNHPISSI
jgi:hypothetical protein